MIGLKNEKNKIGSILLLFIYLFLFNFKKKNNKIYNLIMIILIFLN